MFWFQDVLGHWVISNRQGERKRFKRWGQQWNRPLSAQHSIAEITDQSQEMLRACTLWFRIEETQSSFNLRLKIIPEGWGNFV